MADFIPKDNWLPINRPNLTARVPYGYRTDNTDLTKFYPDYTVLKFVEQALDYYDEGTSGAQVAAWLSEATGKKISYAGVFYIWNKMRGDDKNNPRVKARRAKKRRTAPKTWEEIQERAIKRKIASARNSETRQQQKLEKLEAKRKEKEAEEAEKAGPTPLEFFANNKPEPPKEVVGKKIIFQPNPGPQTAFLAATEQEVLYGGAAGGGKSYALLADPMRYFHMGAFRGLILRRTNDELRELKWKSRELYPFAFPGAKFREKDSLWVFPSGAELWLTYLERDEDVLRYQGQAFSYIGVDELTHYATPFAWNYLRSRLRTTDPNLPLFMRATTNPGGPGHGWVKKMFIDPAPYGEAFDARDLDTNKVLTYPEGHKFAGRPLFQRRFIPARLSDNPHLYNGGQYEANLLSLPEAQRRRLLEGDWNIMDGAAFPEFSVSDHVIEPYAIPRTWRRFRSCDYGYSSYSAVHWYAIDPLYETLVVYRELYVTHMTGRELAQTIRQIESEAEENMMYGVLDSSVWHQRGHVGPTIAEEMLNEGVRWKPSDRTAGARISGRNRLHELLKIREVYDRDNAALRVPGIVFFNTCRQIVADLQVIPTDPDGGEDIDDRYTSDHAYDSIRYGIMSRPRAGTPFDGFNNVVRPSYRPADARFGY